MTNTSAVTVYDAVVCNGLHLIKDVKGFRSSYVIIGVMKIYHRGIAGIIALVLAAAALTGGAYYVSTQNDVQLNPEAANTSEITATSTGQATSTATTTASLNSPSPSLKPSPTPSDSLVSERVSGNVQAAAASQPVMTAPRPITSSGSLDVILQGTQWKAGGTYTVQWEPERSINERRYSDFKVELIEPNRIDRGPVLIASYSNRDIEDIPRLVRVTLPVTMNTNTLYAIKVTYRTSSENYFGDAGFKGDTYTGVTSSFKIVDSDDAVTTAPSSGAAALTPLTLSVPSNVRAQSTSVPFVRFRVTSDDGAVILTHLAIGSPTGNNIFNYVENIKAQVNGEVIPLSFSNEYLLGTTLWKLQRSLAIPANSSETITITADIKPGISNISLQAAVKGGRASAPLSGSVTGPTVEVD